MWSPSTRRTLNPASRARSASASASPGTRTVRVSKYDSVTTSRPAAESPAASAFASRCTRAAMARSRSGPWYTAYIPAITASSTWAVQMFEVAFSRRMCCSRVCNAMRSAGRPRASTETPMIRPGVWRLYASRVAKNAACGPPNPIGTPKRWALPTTTSAPNAPGGSTRQSARRSAAKTARPFAACTRSTIADGSRNAPLDPGYWTSAPNTSPSKASWPKASRPNPRWAADRRWSRSKASPPKASRPNARYGSPTTTSIPSGAARVRITAMVCGWQSASTKNRADFDFDTRRAIAIASAAAVASSSSEALASSIPVKSITICWKSSRASSRPWLTSAWYGV